MDWFAEVEKRKDELIKDTQEFLRIKSVLNEEEIEENAPFGRGIKEALEFSLNKCQEYGLATKNLKGYAGHAEIGKGEEIVGVLCHVDVVPEGDGWTSPPYAAEIRDGKIFARGAIDDKGPTMAAIYALRIIKELNLDLNRRVRIILGTDEESGWNGVDYYFKHEEMPTFGFAPDADFPIIITEKGITTIGIQEKGIAPKKEQNKAFVNTFFSGSRTNMVPDRAQVELEGEKALLQTIKEDFEEFLKSYEYGGEFQELENKLMLRLIGVSAHGMEPYKGVNAGLELIHFLVGERELIALDDWILWVDEHLFYDHYGKKLGIQYEDMESGHLTVNPGIINAVDGNLDIKLNIRYPISNPYEDMLTNMKTKLEGTRLQLLELDNSKPHHVDSNHFLVKTLKKVYEEQTGQEAALLSIGGGTYARALESGVAFGPLFPGKKETAHQKDEYIEIEDLLKATVIYAQAIYELAK